MSSLVQSAVFSGNPGIGGPVPGSLAGVGIGNLIVVSAGFNTSGGVGPNVPAGSSGVSWLDGTDAVGLGGSGEINCGVGISYGLATASSVSLTYSTGNNFNASDLQMTVWEFAGVNALDVSTAPITGFPGGSPRSTPALTPGAANEAFVAVAGQASATGLTGGPGAPWTTSGATPHAGLSAYLINAGVGAESAAFTGSNVGWSLFAACFKEIPPAERQVMIA